MDEFSRLMDELKAIESDLCKKAEVIKGLKAEQDRDKRSLKRLAVLDIDRAREA